MLWSLAGLPPRLIALLLHVSAFPPGLLSLCPGGDCPRGPENRDTERTTAQGLCPVASCLSLGRATLTLEQVERWEGT